MRLSARLMPLALAAAFALPAADKPAVLEKYPPVGEIVAKAIEWAKWHEQQEFHKQWTFDYHRTTRHLNDSEEVKSTETHAFKAYPLAGGQYYELVRHNGEPLGPSERRKEEKRKREFVEKASGRDGGKEGQDGDDFKFDQDLVSRFRAEVVGMEEVAGRPAYVVRFEPKEGPLPVRRRIDHALNSSRGKLWICTEESVVLQIEIELGQPVRVWGGILGTVSGLRARVTMTELGGGAWHYEKMRLYLKGRVLFKSFHEDRSMEWTNFQRTAPPAR